jgi:hypothetical protein
MEDMMGLGDFLKKQFVDVIDWVDEPGVLAIRYPMQDREIQNGGQLTVREGQTAIFYNEGKLADAFQAGQHTLNTQNLPLLTAIMNWDKGFQSPFKADVYFFSLREQTGLKWGTPQPITVRDKEFGAIRIRAFGTYSFRVEDVAVFGTKMMGSLDRLTTADLDQQLRAVINQAIATALGGSDIAFLDLAANQQAHLFRRKRLAARQRPGISRQGQPGARRRQPRPICQVPGGGLDQDRGRERRRHGRDWRDCGGGARDGPADGGCARWRKRWRRCGCGADGRSLRADRKAPQTRDDRRAQPGGV